MVLIMDGIANITSSDVRTPTSSPFLPVTGRCLTPQCFIVWTASSTVASSSIVNIGLVYTMRAMTALGARFWVDSRTKISCSVMIPVGLPLCSTIM